MHRRSDDDFGKEEKKTHETLLPARWLKRDCRARAVSSPTGNIASSLEKRAERGRMRSAEACHRGVTIESEPVNLASANQRADGVVPIRCPHAACGGGITAKILPKFSQLCVRQLALTWRSPAFWSAFNSEFLDPASRLGNACFNDRSRTRANCTYPRSIDKDLYGELVNSPPTRASSSKTQLLIFALRLRTATIYLFIEIDKIESPVDNYIGDLSHSDGYNTGFMWIFDRSRIDDGFERQCSFVR